MARRDEFVVDSLGLTRFGGRFSYAAFFTDCISSNLIGAIVVERRVTLVHDSHFGNSSPGPTLQVSLLGDSWASPERPSCSESDIRISILPSVPVASGFASRARRWTCSDTWCFHPCSAGCIQTSGATVSFRVWLGIEYFGSVPW